MIDIKLNVDQFEYVYSNLSSEREDLAKILKKSEKNGKITMTLEEDVVDEIRDWVEERLQKVGFDKDYSLTKEGELLEELSNILFLG